VQLSGQSEVIVFSLVVFRVSALVDKFVSEIADFRHANPPDCCDFYTTFLQARSFCASHPAQQVRSSQFMNKVNQSHAALQPRRSVVSLDLGAESHTHNIISAIQTLPIYSKADQLLLLYQTTCCPLKT